MTRFPLLALCLLLWPGLALTCDWDPSVDPDQGLAPASAADGPHYLRWVNEAANEDACRAACCAEPGCDLALLGFPADGSPQCRLLRCRKDGRDTCELEPSTQFKVYRRKADGEKKKPHIVPLVGLPEPKSNLTDDVHCYLPVKVGLCRAAFPRFYYDVTNQSCKGFTYGGCSGNSNNFKTQEECEASCSGVKGSVYPPESTEVPSVKAPRMAPPLNPSPEDSEAATPEPEPVKDKAMLAEEYSEHCEAEPKVGPCRAAFRHWYHDKKTGSCQSFIYGGCKGNKNNYNSEEACKSMCLGITVLPSSKKVASDDETSTDDTEACMLPPDAGPCRAAFPMFYYDADTDTCRSFTYGGCRGNQNRHDSLEECMSHCSGNGVLQGRGRPRSRWTAAFFMLLTLAAISALLVASLVVMTLRRHLSVSGASIISDKEELLPDPDEQSSNESLSVPESPKLGVA